VEQGRLWSEPVHLLELAAIGVVAAVAVWLVVRRRWSDAAWAAAAVALPISTGIPGGIPRFFVVVYPIYFAMAELTGRSAWARRAAWVVSSGLLLWASARFVNWFWVA
jgi:type IV secretory pathway VirB2 component (pilin)